MQAFPENRSHSEEDASCKLSGSFTSEDDEKQLDAIPDEANGLNTLGARVRVSTHMNGDLDIGLPITFQNITFSVGRKQRATTILHGVTGYFEGGSMTALMGPSGSGKTSLLDIIAGRKNSGNVSGDVRFAGKAPIRAFLRRYTAYVEQFDHLVDNLTVYEMLLYTAELKSPWKESLDEKSARVESIISALGLSSCANTLIGSSLHRGISGGQLKRCNIGMSLVGSPMVLFLDEPTSGLDSFAAEEVMLTVRKLANQGLTICSTIHAPSASVSALFDRMLILVNGRVVFFGGNGEAVPYFSALAEQTIGHSSLVSDAEWITKVVVEASRSDEPEKYANHYASSQLATAAEARTAALANPDQYSLTKSVKAVRSCHSTTNPSWWSVRTLLKYRMRADYKSALFWSPRIVDKAAFAFIIATLYWSAGRNGDQSDTLNVSAALYMCSLLPAFASITFLPALILERLLYVRERHDGLYTAGAYLLHKLIIEVTVIVLVSIPFALAVWFAVGFSGSFAVFLLVYIVTTIIGVALGYFVSSIAPNMEIAQVATCGYVSTLLFFSGLIMRLDDIPDYWYWFSVINFLRYSWGSLMVNQFENLPDAEWPIVSISPLTYLGLDGEDKWAYFGYECIFIFVFAFGAWAGLAFMRYGRR